MLCDAVLGHAAVVRPGAGDDEIILTPETEVLSDDARQAITDFDPQACG